MDSAKLNDSAFAVISIQDVFPLSRLRTRSTRTRNRDWLQSVPGFFSRDEATSFPSIESINLANRTHRVALWARKTSSVTSLCFENVFRYYQKGKKRKENLFHCLHTFCQYYQSWQRVLASDNAPSIYHVPFLRLSSVLIALNPLPTSYP